GVASFADLTVNIAGTYSLQATAEAVDNAYKPASQVSNSFNVGVYSLTSAQGNIAPSTQDTGFIFGVLSAISPTDFSGAVILTLVTLVDLPIDGSSVYTTTFSTATLLPQDAFTSITLGGRTLNSADATYIAGPPTNWLWSGLGSTNANLIQAAG